MSRRRLLRCPAQGLKHPLPSIKYWTSGEGSAAESAFPHHEEENVNAKPLGLSCFYADENTSVYPCAGELAALMALNHSYD